MGDFQICISVPLRYILGHLSLHFRTWIKAWSAPDFSGVHILSCKKETSVWSKIFSQTDKTMKKLQRIPNTIVSTSALLIFWSLHIWRCQNWFVYSWIEKHLIDRTDQRYNWALQISTIDVFYKNSNINLNTVIILTKISIWDVWMGPECASTGGSNKTFKIQAETSLWQQVKLYSS